jgi:CubicO group peptidase (beta-lactamase class C family)
MKNIWTSQDGKQHKVSDLDYQHARNIINKLTRQSSPQFILELILDAIKMHDGMVQRKTPRELVLNGDMAQQFNEIQQMAEYDEYEEWYEHTMLINKRDKEHCDTIKQLLK